MKNKLSVVLSASALMIAVAAAGGPAIAGAIASDSDKVDGLHAVKYGATVDQRKGKLVATSTTTGRLPDNTIGKAPDAAKLNGFTPAQMRSFQLPPLAADKVGGAVATGGGGVPLPATGSPTVVWTFVVPPDYTAGAPIKMDLYYAEPNGGGCSFLIKTVGAHGPIGNTQVPHSWVVTGSSPNGQLAIPSHVPGVSVGKQTISWSSPQTKPGMYVALSMARDSGNILDNCPGAMLLAAGQVRY